MGEIPRSARDDGVVDLVFSAKAAAARRRFVFANRSRSERQTAARRAEQRSEIPDLDAALENFAGLDQRDAALRGQILRETSGREPNRARALRIQSRSVPPRHRRRIDNYDAARAAPVSSSHPKRFGKARANRARFGTGTALFEGRNFGGLSESRALRSKPRRHRRGQLDLFR